MNKKSMDNITAVLILIDKDAPKVLEPKKSLSSLLHNENHNMKSKKDLKKVLDDFSKNRKRHSESQSKENTNTANTVQEKEEKEEEALKMKKKSSMQMSTKRLDILKKAN